MIRARALLLSVLLAVGPARAAEPWLESVDVEARLEAGEPATISMSYLLRPERAASIAFRSIRFEKTRVTNVRAFVNGLEVPFRGERSAGERVDGRVELPLGARTADRVPLTLVYEVRPAPAAFERRSIIVMPLLVAAWPPRESLAETFQASVTLPAGLAVRSSFPSEPERIEPDDPATGGSVYRFALPVVPALLRLETVAGAPPLLTAERAMDLVAIGVLLFLAVYGWRRMRETLA